MRLFGSFLLTSFIYSGIIGFFLYFLLSQQKQEKPQIVYIHQVIIQKKSKKTLHKKVPVKKNIEKKQKIDKPKKEVKKTVKKPLASKNTLSTGGDNIKLDDIFSNVSANVKTTKIKQKKRYQLTKQKSISKEIKQQLSQIKTSMSVSTTSGKAEDVDYIQNELAKVWNSILTNDGDFIKIQIRIQNGNLNFSVISTNLDTIRLQQFITKLKNIDTTKLKNLNAVIDFKSKLKENQ